MGNEASSADLRCRRVQIIGRGSGIVEEGPVLVSSWRRSTLAGLRRYFVLFVLELKSRRVRIAGIHPQPYGEWMEPMARI